jgi:hypothetical protein
VYKLFFEVHVPQIRSLKIILTGEHDVAGGIGESAVGKADLVLLTIGAVGEDNWQRDW